jgi:ribosomal protein L30E
MSRGATDSLLVHLGPPCPTLLCPAGGPPPGTALRLFQGWPSAIFYFFDTPRRTLLFWAFRADASRRGLRMKWRPTRIEFLQKTGKTILSCKKIISLTTKKHGKTRNTLEQYYQLCNINNIHYGPGQGEIGHIIQVAFKATSALIGVINFKVTSQECGWS